MTRHTHTRRFAVALVIAVAVVFPAAASARFDQNPVYVPSHQAAAAVRVVRVGGFDWGDAAIGAAAGLGIAMLALAGGRVAVRRRRPGASPAIG